MTRLVLSGVVAGYGQGDILRGVDLEVEPDAITCLIGPNGAGKSTVLRVVSGLLRPRQGTIHCDGELISGRSPRAILDLGIVHVPQERSLFPLMTVWENVLLGGHVLGTREARTRLEQVAERYPIVRERRRERAGALSGGQQKVVEIARAMMLEPRVILMDEPSTGLDPRSRRQVFETIAALGESGRTVLLVEQNARAGLSISQHGAVLDGGRVRLRSSSSGLLESPLVAELYLGAAGGPAAAGSSAHGV